MDNNTDERFGTVEERETDESTEESNDVQVEESTDNQEATETQETEENQETEQTQQSEETQDTEVQQEDQPKRTEKGTKLDPNPQSAVHQELANERRARLDRDKVLGNPELLARYMETQFGVKVQPRENTQTEEVKTKKYTADDFQHIEDVAETVNKLQDGFEQKIQSVSEENKQLKQAVSSLLFNDRASQVARTMETDITSLRSEPELNPRSPDFIEGLEEEIASMYHQLDFDESIGGYRGKQSLADIGKRIISTARKARQKGSIQAQTIVKDKSEGRVRTSQKSTNSVNTDNLPAADSIAAGIAKTFGRN